MPYCQRCSHYGHTKQRCLESARELLKNYDLRTTDVLFDKAFVEKIVSREQSEELENTVRFIHDFYDERFTSAQKRAAEYILTLGKVQLAEAQYFPESLLHALEDHGHKDFSNLHYAIQVVSHKDFPPLCFACGDLGHQVDACKDCPTHMDAVHHYASYLIKELHPKDKDVMISRILRLHHHRYFEVMTIIGQSTDASTPHHHHAHTLCDLPSSKRKMLSHV